MNEIQITDDVYGHTLNHSQVFSPDGQWIVYDTRNDDTHIARTSRVEKVNITTGQVVVLYDTKSNALFGPGVGAVAYHPLEEKVIFIHGLENCSEAQPYGFTRRFGAIIEGSQEKVHHAEARKITSPLIEGALRGGTHAHSWSADGQYISFTYNDYLLERLEKVTNGNVRDLRCIGAMNPDRRVKVSEESAEEFSGNWFSFLAATVVDSPRPGSDDIERAFDECWIGVNGYLKTDGLKQRRAIAFQGNVVDAAGSVVTELFVSDIPERIMATPGKPLEGSMETRPNVPLGIVQRRLTFTSNNKYPGLQGPRCRVRSSPDGSTIYFHMKDDNGVVQIYRIPTQGGATEKITSLSTSIQGQYNISPDGSKLSVIADNRIWIVDLSSRQTQPVTRESTRPVIGGAHWSPDGKTIVFNRHDPGSVQDYLQIFKIDL